MGTFTGTTGDDTLAGGPGPDTLIGLAGNDTYVINDAGDQTIEAVGEGYDVAYSLVSYTLAAGQSIEALALLDFASTAALNLTGNELVNYLLGNAGDNQLNGGAGADAMEGRGGNDTYIVDNANDQVGEAAGKGYDVIYSSVSYTLAAGQEIEALATSNFAGTTAINFTGNEIANYLVGNAGDNQLSGGAGADALEGRGGNDNYIVDNVGDQTIEAAGQGYDAVYTSISYTLTAGQEIEALALIDFAGTAALNLTGNEFANYLLGNAGDNQLNGAAGADAMDGRGGNDTFIVDNAGDQVIEAVGKGYDVIYSSVSYTLAAGQEIEALATSNFNGTAALNLTGNELANYIVGNAGDNQLSGGAGADVLDGRGGNDTYLVDNAGDQALEAAAGGTDTVRTSVSYTLSANIENLEATAGTAALNLTGNDSANSILGNAGANILDGGIGADTLTGGLGDDIYLVDNGSDVVVENAGEGSDTIRASVSYTLGANVSVETLEAATGTAAINLTGNNSANTVKGNDGANVLDGGFGNDTLTGGLGADFFAFTTILGGNNNIDVITDFLVGTDKILLGGAIDQVFAPLATGSLRAGTLVIGTAALDADDYIIYNSVTGALFYDQDGNGVSGAFQFATLATGLNLTLADFMVSGAVNVAPTITSGATASIAENSAASTIVYQTAASDADGDRVTYTLSGTDANLLSIDANGAVRLLASADFESKNSYSFNVVASDSGTSTTKAVTLTITDVADSASTPIINENGSNDTRLTAQAIDPNTFLIASNPNLVNDSLPSASIVGSISTPNDDLQAGTSTDVDFYSITLQAGQQLILDVDGTNGLDSFLTLYGPNGGTVIGSNDDTGAYDPGSTNTAFGHNVNSQIIFRAATAGTYYFSIKSFVDEDTGQQTSRGNYTLHVSINSTPATAAQIMAEDVQALVSGSSWNHAGPAFNLTFGFPTLASQYPQNFPEVAPSGQGDPTPVFEAFNVQQQAATRSLLQLIANVTQITFTENTTQGNYNVPGTAANANLRYAESNEAAPAAYAYYPTNNGPTSNGGSAWFDNTHFNAPLRGNYAWMGILHETGHTLGLKHGHEFPLAISADHDSLEYSVMTYRSYPGQDLSGGGGYSNEQWGYAQTLMMLDIAALQKIYGSANYAYNSSNSIYTWNAATGEMSINGVGQGAPGDGVGLNDASENRVFMTIWDGNGTDTYDLSNYTTSTIVDLRPGEWTTTSGAQLANLGQGHFARGNVANALLFEGDTRSAIENGIGGSGSDTLIANQVANSLTGNLGTDAFKWMSNGDAGLGNLADTVTDFTRGADKIDFTKLDANPATTAHDAFSFIGTAVFHNVAGEVRYDVTGGNAHIFVDTDGNGSANMEIILTGITTLAGTDFNF